MPTTTSSTTLLESVNIVLANLGESPVNSLTGGALPQQVSLALNTIEEVSTDIQSKGWWFNQQSGGNYIVSGAGTAVVDGTYVHTGTHDNRNAYTLYDTDGTASHTMWYMAGTDWVITLNDIGEYDAYPRYLNSTSSTSVPLTGWGAALGGTPPAPTLTLVEEGNYDTTANVVIHPSNTANDWGTDIPEEARRYITIRASRIAQTRLIGSEELQKFSYNEELVSLAILQQAHVRNSNGVLDFNAFPAELRGLGMDEVMFLQGNVEEKIGTLRLGGELANIAKTKAETDLIADQEALVAQQALTEVQETAKRTKESALIDAQEALLQKQILTEAEQVAKVQEEVDLLQTQDTLVTNQAETELKTALKVVADTTLVGKQGSLVDAQATDVAADTTLKGKQGSLVDAQATDVAADTSLKGVQEDLVETQITDVAADTALKTSQKIQLDAQTAIEATAEKAFYDGVVAGTQSTYRDFAAEMRMMGIQESTFQSTPAYKKIELLKDAEKLRLVTATETPAAGAPPTSVQVSGAGVTAANGSYVRNGNSWDGAPAYTLYDTDGTTELYSVWRSAEESWRIGQSINTTPYLYSRIISQDTPPLSGWYSILTASAPAPTLTEVSATDDPTELAEVNRVMRLIGEPPVLTLNSNSLASEGVRLMRDTDMELQGRGWYFNTDEDGVIAQKPLIDCPRKYLEYLEVRVAILLTELYPQSGVDIQRLPKMELELRAYFKDREFDDANYSIFNSYDVAARVGRNRNYSII